MVTFIEDADRAEPVQDSLPVRRTPWHLWLIGGVSLLWNAFGANDYIQTQTGNLAYFDNMMGGLDVTPAEILAYFQAFPAWLQAFWAFGVWGALVGSVLLVLRSRFAVWAFALSIVGLAVNTTYQLTAAQPDWVEASGPMTIVIWSIATFLLIYAWSMRRKGVLR